MNLSGSTRLFVALPLALGMAAYGACLDPAPPKSTGTGGAGGGLTGTGGNVPPPPIDGLVSLTVSPAAATVSLVYGPAIAPAQQKLTAMGVFKNGTTKDVTASVSWTVDPPDVASVADGGFQSSVAGKFTVTASSGSVDAVATVRVKITGEAVDPGVTKASLDGAPGGGAPTIAYPLDGALFPRGLAKPELQMVPSSPQQSVGRVAIEGELVDLRVYAPCAPISPAAIAGACAVTLPADLEAHLAGASEGDTMSTRVRLAAPDGGGLGESAPIDVRWSSTSLGGGLYFWSAEPPNSGGKNKLMRYNLDKPGAGPEVYYTDDDTKTLADSTKYYQPCFGCHAISPDGEKIALTFGGSVPSLFALLDVATKKVITSADGTQKAIRVGDNDGPGFKAGDGFATQTVFSPDGTRMVQAFRGQLLQRMADETLATAGPPLFTATLDPLGEKATEPFWGGDGSRLVFSSWKPDGGSQLTGDIIPGSQIWIAEAKSGAFAEPTVLVPRADGKTEFYPALSDDGQLVVFNESICSGPPTPSSDGWGGSPCDSYDDPSARLRLVSASGGAPVDLARASGSDTWSNSWPRFAPDHGRFQGKVLYWIAFSSRRPYGARLPGSNAGSTKPQLWFSAVAVDSSGKFSADPSFAPVWMPAQNEIVDQPRGNHVPQWVTKAVDVIPK